VLGLPALAFFKLYRYSRSHSSHTADLDSKFNELVDLRSEEPCRLDDEDVQRRYHLHHISIMSRHLD
jgi:hypothetical protein